MPAVVRQLRLTARVFVGAIGAILLAVTEQPAFDAVAVTAGQEAVLAERFVGHQQWLHFALFVLEFAVLHGLLPVAGLLLDVEEETGGATDGLQTLNGRVEIIFKPSWLKLCSTHRSGALNDVTTRVAVIGD